MATSTADAIDMRLWEEAKTPGIGREPISWFFANSPFTVMVVASKGAEIRRVTPRSFMELAIFDLMATFWESVTPVAKNGQVAALITYHELLRRWATDELLNQPQGVTRTHTSPSALHPWLKRTLCLLGHDEGARSLFEGLNYPTYLLDDGAFYKRSATSMLSELIHSFRKHHKEATVSGCPLPLHSLYYWRCRFSLA
jgi:hypothetical protein